MTLDYWSVSPTVDGMGKQDAPRSERAELTLDDVLQDGLLRAVFQPIVDLETGVLFGFEALARGPAGSNLEHPDALFAAARGQNRLAELDLACQRAAIAAARANRIEAPLTLFVNAEPDSVGFRPLPQLGRNVRGMIELTEGILTSSLPELLPAVQATRAAGWGVALDDVGADTRSLALMPVLRPDVIKLDLRLVQEQPTPEIAAIAAAVGAQAERTGAVVLAEGIETHDQAEYARALGATLGQGYHFGRPSPEAPLANLTDIPLPIRNTSMPHARRTPIDLVSSHRPVRHGTMPLLSAISRELERHAQRGNRSALLIRTFPNASGSTAHIDTSYDELAEDLAFVAALGVGLPPRLAPGLRGVSIAEDDPLHDAWNVIVISAHFASMLAARERDGGSGADQSFDFVVTYDRDLIVQCAQALMLRIAMSAPPRPAHTPAPAAS
jgi:EAL domain-containing protein (putative c-di-GMP-specific phosphodiesterase class I)